MSFLTPNGRSAPTPPEGGLVPLGHWRVSEASRIDVHIGGLGRSLKGTFGAFSGRLVGERDSVLASGSIDAASIDTGNGERDEFLRGPECLDAASHPQITFASLRIGLARGDYYDIPGTLTIKGVSQQLSLKARHLPPEPGDDEQAVRFSADGQFDRRAFGVKAPPGMLGLSGKMQIRARILVVPDDGA